MRLIFISVMSAVSYALNVFTIAWIASTLNFFDISMLSILGAGLQSGISSIAGTSIVISYFLIGTVLPTRSLRWLGWLSGLWMGLITLTLFFGGSLELLLFILSYLSPSSVDTIRPLASVFVLWLICLSFVWGVWQALLPPNVVRREFALTKVTSDSHFNGFKIIQLSDVHIGQTIGESLIKQMDQICQAEDPDLIVFTGDLVDGRPQDLGDEVKLFLELGRHARFGMYCITGNHEYISGATEWVEFIRSVGGRILTNEHIQLELGEERLVLIGVEDWDAQRFDPSRSPNLSEAMEGVDAETVSILLAHQPKAVFEASERGVDIQLSGHTHGGQIFPFKYFIYMDQPYNEGMYQVGNTKLYVNPGTGYWGPPLRLGTRSEVSIFTLTPAERV